MIRKAVVSDASRIAEILIFTKRMNYRDIFKNDEVSFGEMQVYPLAKSYIEELYVDTFFENQGIGTELMEFAVNKMNCEYLWVLEKNKKAIHFYDKFAFMPTGEREQEEGTTEYIMKMRRKKNQRW